MGKQQQVAPQQVIQPPPPVSTTVDDEAENPIPTVETAKKPTSKAVRDAEALRIRNRMGSGGTIITSPMGVTGGTDSKTLLGL